jgi:hypothetical protein
LAHGGRFKRKKAAEAPIQGLFKPAEMVFLQAFIHLNFWSN